MLRQEWKIKKFVFQIKKILEKNCFFQPGYEFFLDIVKEVGL